MIQPLSTLSNLEVDITLENKDTSYKTSEFFQTVCRADPNGKLGREVCQTRRKGNIVSIVSHGQDVNSPDCIQGIIF
jgi:hypothetical protein